MAVPEVCKLLVFSPLIISGTDNYREKTLRG